MRSKITRRDFLKAAGTIGGLAILSPFPSFISSEVFSASTPEVFKNTTYYSICNFCSSFCDIQVDVRYGKNSERITKIGGNPNSPLNRGKVCARGQSGWLQTYDPDRLKTPLIRIKGSERGEWKFRKATWDEAYDFIADRLKQVNPWEIALVGGWTACVSYMHFSLPFITSYQIPNIIASPLQHCVTAGHLGTDLVTGNFNVHDEILPDFENARYLLFSANNASIAAVSVARAVRFGKAIKNGARVVVLDPRMSELASRADEWLPIKPGTDLAFFLSMMHIIIKEKLYDKEFVALHTNAPFLAYKDKAGNMQLLQDNRKGKIINFYVYDEISGKIVSVPGFINSNKKTTSGKKIVPSLQTPKDLRWYKNNIKVKTVFEFLSEQSEEYSTEWAENITGIKAETIEKIAIDFGRTRPAIIDPGWMGARYDNVITLRRVQAMIQTLIGGIEKSGGWMMGGEYKHKAEKYWHNEKHNKPQPKNAALLPGLKYADVLINQLANPNEWKHKHPAFTFAWAEQQRKNGKPGAAIPGLADTGLLEAVNGDLEYNGQPYNVKSFILNAANPIRHYFPSDRWEKIFKSENVNLVLAIDVLPSDSTAYADVILPNHTYLERNEPLLYPLGPSPDLAFATRFRTIKPLYDTADAVDIFFNIAERLGFFEEYLAGVAEYAELDYELLKKEVNAFKKKGENINEAFLKVAMKSMNEKAKYITRKFSKENSVEKELKEKGVLLLKTQEEMLEEAAMPWKIPVPTTSGRLELYSSFLANLQKMGNKDAVFNPLIEYIPPGIENDKKVLDKNEFYFTYGKTPIASHASTNTNNTLLSAITKTKENEYMGLWMHPEKAKALGLNNGDKIIIKNSAYKREVEGKLHITEGIRPDTVFLPSSFGSKNPKLKTASGKGSSLSDLIPYKIEPLAASFMSQTFTVLINKV
jgi:anaerobic selenocysteine-containing dehydrogenase